MKPKRLGRPPDTTSDETRQRVLSAARECFARFGYSKTTNKDIAVAAGITTGAIYHYFDSKQALFAAVTSEVTAVVFDELQEAVDSQDHFVEKLCALLDAASRLHAEDRSLAHFSATFPIELNRHPELVAFLSAEDVGRSGKFFRALARQAKTAGELPDDISVDDMANMILSLTIGLAYFGTLVDSTKVHRSAVLAVERLLVSGLASPAVSVVP
jgi:AcrR family transcriptional regulator